jgi:hypothetical protein
MKKLFHELPVNVVDLLITAINDKRIQKASGPNLLHIYLSFDENGGFVLKRVALSCITRKLKTSIDPLETFIDKLLDIANEIKQDCLQDAPTLYLYDFHKKISVDLMETKLYVRYAVPPQSVLIETKDGVDKVLKKEGINYLLKNFGEVLVRMSGIPKYIKIKYPELKDKVQLWETLHGIPK